MSPCPPLEITDAGGTFERVGQPGIAEAFSHQELAEMIRRPDTTYFAGYFDRAAQQIRRSKPVELSANCRRKSVGWLFGERHSVTLSSLSKPQATSNARTKPMTKPELSSERKHRGLSAKVPLLPRKHGRARKSRYEAFPAAEPRISGYAPIRRQAIRHSRSSLTPTALETEAGAGVPTPKP